MQVGLFNNAGLPGFSEPVELLSMDQLRGVFEVNFFGLVATTKAFLPLLREGHGRIVNTSRSVHVNTFCVDVGSTSDI